MVEENRPSGGDQPEPTRYLGPFGGSSAQTPGEASERTQPLGIGNWQQERPDFDPHELDRRAGAQQPPRATSPSSSAPFTSPYAPPSGPYSASPSSYAASSYAPASSYPSAPSPYAGPPAARPTAGPGAWPPPVGAPAPGSTPPPRRRGGGAGVVVAAGVVALLVGSAAGFGGARLAQSPLAQPVPSSAPTDPGAPSASESTNTEPASPVPAAPGQLDTVAVAATALPSTVMIQVGRGTSRSVGSGFVLDTDGHVMTNNHVVADAADGAPLTVVMADGRTTAASLVGRSPSYDLAVIKLRRTSGLKPMKIGSSAQLAVGQPVVAVGAPLGLPGTVTQGIVSAKDRPVAVDSDSDADAPKAYINGVQTDTAINPGNSGGPLIDAAARVVGVNSAILTLGQSRGQAGNIGLGFAIPIDQAMQIGKLLIKDGKASYPVIGASVGDKGDAVALSAVDGGGPAAKAGLRVDDVVTAVDDKAVASADQLIVAIRTHRPGDKVTLAYERGSRRATATVTLGGREG